VIDASALEGADAARAMVGIIRHGVVDFVDDFSGSFFVGA